MCVCDGGEHVEKQTDTGFNRQPLLVAVPVDVAAFHVLEDQIGLASVRHAGVDQTSDLRMRQAREDRPLAFEALLTAAADERSVEQLHGGAALEAAIAARGQPDGAHSAVADPRHQRIRAEHDACQCRLARLNRRGRIEKAFSGEAAVIVQQRRQVGGRFGI